MLPETRVDTEGIGPVGTALDLRAVGGCALSID